MKKELNSFGAPEPLRLRGAAMHDVSDPPIELADAILSQIASHARLAAVDQDGQAISYEEFWVLACKFAGAIRQFAATPCPRVLVASQSSAGTYAGMVATVIAGGSFCPINTRAPEGRNADICRSFLPHVVLYEGTSPPYLDVLPVTTHCLDTRQLDSRSLDVPATERSDVAYVVFTSGSTGIPKGVKVGRRAFAYFLQIASKHFDLPIGERWAQYSNLGHDLGIMDVFMALAQGGTLVPLNDAERLRPATAIRDKRLSVWQSVPSVVDLMLRSRQLTADTLAPLKVMSFCGEPLHPHQLQALFAARPDLLVFNTYGTTETTGFNTFNRLTAADYAASCASGAVAIGDDVPGWGITLRGGDTEDEGEIVVVSDHLSLGYWQDETQTRAAFRDVDFGEGCYRRSYFTGDRGVRKGSSLYCSGRLDRQVKIRGERIELDEIDARLRETGFAAAYTIMKEDELYSFVESTEEVDQERVRSHLGTALPFHAIPKSVCSLPALPRNPNGKTDREALAKMVPK